MTDDTWMLSLSLFRCEQVSLTPTISQNGSAEYKPQIVLMVQFSQVWPSMQFGADAFSLSRAG